MSMRKSTCAELHKLGWEFGLYDTEKEQWDALSVDHADLVVWIEDAENVGQYQAYNLSTGKQIQS